MITRRRQYPQRHFQRLAKLHLDGVHGRDARGQILQRLHQAALNLAGR